jgi:hypothetical protein
MSRNINKTGRNPEGLCLEKYWYLQVLCTTKKKQRNCCKIGCNVLDSVTQKNHNIICGNSRSTKLAGYEKKSKHRKAEKLIEKGNQN